LVALAIGRPLCVRLVLAPSVSLEAAPEARMACPPAGSLQRDDQAMVFGPGAGPFAMGNIRPDDIFFAVSNDRLRRLQEDRLRIPQIVSQTERYGRGSP